MIDELPGRPPLEFRRAARRPAPLVRALKARRTSGGHAAPAGRARGFAVHESFGSIVAEVAEVSSAITSASACTGERAVTAADGQSAGIEAQLQSAVVFALRGVAWRADAQEGGGAEQLPRLSRAAHPRDAGSVRCRSSRATRRWAASVSQAPQSSRRR